MGLFSRRSAEPIVHPEVRRSVHVRAGAEAVEAQLRAYSDMQSPKHAGEILVGLSSDGDWTSVELPRALHPWVFHNLAYWLLDTVGADNEMIAQSAAGPGYGAYRLVRDPELDDSLSGWGDDGEGWTVEVPSNDIVRPEEVPVPRDRAIPSPGESVGRLRILVEDPGRAQNAANEATVASRKKLRDRHSMTYM